MPEVGREETRPGVRVEVDHDPRINLALHQNDVPVVKQVRVINDLPGDLEDLEVRLWIGGGLSHGVRLRLAGVEAGACRVLDQVDLRVDPELLRSQRERERALLHVELRQGEKVLLRRESEIQVLAPNEWGGLQVLPEILAAFVLPNDPAVERILARARLILRETTGSGDLCGYQREDPERVRAVATAVFRALRELDIGYVTPPASFEAEGQKVRTPARILENRLATCLDLSLLFAACLEQCGLHPLIVLTEGHAFAGCWTEDCSFQEPCIDDAARLRKLINLSRLTAFETTLATTDSPASFEEACAAGLRRLERNEEFLCAIDVRAARKLSIRPLSLREEEAPESLPPLPEVAPEVAAERSRSPEGPEPSPLPRPDSGETPSGEALPHEAEDSVEQTSRSRLERWKRKLLDLSLRNRLLNFRPTRKTLELMVPDLGVLEDAVAAGTVFSILPRPQLAAEDQPRDLELHRERTNEDALEAFLAQDLAERRLHAALAADELESRLIEIYRAARTSLEETGASTLYLALGFLSYYESESSARERRAPILLLPIQITRRSLKEGFRIRAADDEPRVNITLLEKLKQDHAIDVAGLEEIPEDEHGVDVKSVLDRFREAVLSMDRWDVREDAAIGLFSFSKFLMWQDLEERSATLLEAPVVRHLVEHPEETYPDDGDWPRPESLDEERRAAETLCPLDADSSQLAAVFAGGDGRTFVLQGPPGTGKSQTITNLIGHAIAHGRRVLFVAEKMAALDVVHKRLEDLGLDRFCLEVHSNKASKRRVLDQIQKALDATAGHPPEEWAEMAQRLEQERKALNAVAEALHRRRGPDLSFREATVRLIGLRHAKRFRLSCGDPLAMEASRLRDLKLLAERLATAAQAVQPVPVHPLAALTFEEWRPTLRETLEEATTRLLEAETGFREKFLELGAFLGLTLEGEDGGLSRLQVDALEELCRLLLDQPGPGRRLLVEEPFDVLATALERGLEQARERERRCARLNETRGERFTDLEPGSWLSRSESIDRSFVLLRPFRRWSFARAFRKATGRAPGEIRGVEEDLRELSALRSLETELSDADHPAAAVFGAEWWKQPRAFDGFERRVRWAQAFRAALARLGDRGAEPRILALATDERSRLVEGAPERLLLESTLAARERLLEAQSRAETALALDPQVAFGEPGAGGHLERLRRFAKRAGLAGAALKDWCHWRRVRAEAMRAGLGELVSALDDDRLPAGDLPRAFERSFLEAFQIAVLEEDEVLRRFNSHEHERRVSEFRRLDRKLMELSRDVIQARLAARIPKLAEDLSTRSEAGILKHQLKLKRRHLPIRRLFEKTPRLLPLLKPCLLMSPLSVASYLAPDHPRFDLVIFDEASQIPVWDAIGALARGRAAVIVGDSKQLPPTAFFMRLDGESDQDLEVDLPDLESILDEAEASGLKALRLRWHYRSRHESLIAFSNHHYYDDELVTFPSAAREVPGSGVSLRFVERGVYDRGRSATNLGEAEAIRDEILRRLLGASPEDAPSIGVVAFSSQQQGLIEDLLDQARREHPEIESFFSDAVPEPVFIKNLENVQGDERDVILFSICYGPDAAGRMTMNFGPLNRVGGERRLNVAITRSRREVLVFSSIRPEQIDLSRTRAVGVRHLRFFLDYAWRGPRAMVGETADRLPSDLESPFEEALHAALTRRGFDVDRKVGCSDFRIDLAVRHPKRPGSWILGILCDGPSYGLSATARDRDRLREEVLQRLGWSLHRVWSADWWEDPEGETKRLVAVVESLLNEEDARGASRTRDGDPDATAAHDPPREPAAPELSGADAAARGEAVSGAGGEEDAPASRPGPVLLEVEGRETTLGPPEAFHDPAADELIRQCLRGLIAREAPIHLDRLCRGVAAAFSIERIGARVRRRVEDVLQTLPEEERPIIRSGFVWAAGQQPTEWRLFRVPSPGSSNHRSIDEIPIVEIANAMRHVLEREISLPRDDLVRETAHLLGIGRAGKHVRSRVASALAHLEEAGGCLLQDERVILPPPQA